MRLPDLLELEGELTGRGPVTRLQVGRSLGSQFLFLFVQFTRSRLEILNEGGMGGESFVIGLRTTSKFD